MNVGQALALVGCADLVMGFVFLRHGRRLSVDLSQYPDPLLSPMRLRRDWQDLSQRIALLTILRVVCFNTGGSMVCTGLILMLGWL